MEYFKHDINASEDDKICELLANGGYEMLGYYWRFIEYLYSRNGKVCKNKLNSIAWSLHMDTNKLKELIANYGLFYEDEEYIFSKRVLAEVEEFEAVGKRMAEIGKAGGKASAKAKAQANAQADGKRTVKRAVSECSTEGQADAQQNKKKKIKENKINNMPDGDNALTGKLPDGYSIHENSGEVYTIVDGVMYNIYGEELNSQGFKKIDFNLSKHNL
jgi:uncharacterized protein YdaU (DUF1376 family)